MTARASLLAAMLLGEAVAVRLHESSEELDADDASMEGAEGWPWKKKRSRAGTPAAEDDDILSGPPATQTSEKIPEETPEPSEASEKTSAKTSGKDSETTPEKTSDETSKGGPSPSPWWRRGGGAPTPAPRPKPKPFDPKKAMRPTSTPDAATQELPECNSIKSFRYKYMDEYTEKEHFTGQCTPSMSPGAYYYDDNSGEDQWACWNVDTPRDFRTKEQALEQGYDGACYFPDHYSAKAPVDAATCPKVVVDCSPGYSLYWGACYSDTSDKWLCFRQPSAAEDPDQMSEMIRQVATGDCRSTVVREDVDGTFYDGVCQFDDQKEVAYRCETVPTYEASSGMTCGSGVGGAAHSACFSLASRVPWQCFPKSLDNPGCSSTPSNEGTYDGTCYFPKAPEYRRAKSGADLETREFDDGYGDDEDYIPY